ncbi:folate-binding protein [Actinomadura sp. NBRC 104425]|uniref:CAF17-like 4Fe-4S cluster assembly/insertion protein YgfZ n=1 Tax=Actinomadura sp. NBRC 104425 TaxID=3032204 RepID=UPI0024A518AC|nr:glycine cleavage T C-terminal barrel domain-containing protein [Actinomadura sp. NBRC 104425]GLZ14613.1 folate-binding protein [Actinomadura sp. NBRC 104425]
MESPLLKLPGAVAADAPDQDIAAHYGEPAQEQRALEAGEAFVDRSNRGVVRVSGPDRLSWLHSLTSQHLQNLKPYEPTEALLLSPHGHIEHHMHLVDDGEAVWMHVEPGTAGALVEFLDKMRFMLRVEVADVSDAYAVVTTGRDPGPGALALPDVAGTAQIVKREELAGLPETARPAGIWAYEALRIAAHRPRLGLDTDHRSIPHEMGLIETAVHLSKGCYRGQETVARVHNLGRPPRRLVFLHLDGSVDRLPAHGDPVEIPGGRTVGFVGSAARHHELGPIALALVKRNVPVDAELLAGGVAAAQEVIVSPDTGANAKINFPRQAARRA